MKIQRILLAVAALLIFTIAGCGGGEEEEIAPADSTAAGESPDSIAREGESTLRSAAQEILDTPQTPSGAAALVNEAQSAADQANQRTEELQQMMEGM